MKKNTKFLVLGGVFIVALSAFLFFSGVLSSQSVFSSSFTPVYCADPSSVCCVKTQTSGSVQLSASTSWLCNSKLKCSVSASGTGYLYTGSKNCRVVSDFSTLFVSVYRCDDQVQIKSASQSVSNYDVAVGYRVYSDRVLPLSYTVDGQKLVTNLGVTVQSDSCAFSVSYGTTMTDKDGRDLGVSYTVPVGSDKFFLRRSFVRLRNPFKENVKK